MLRALESIGPVAVWTGAIPATTPHSPPRPRDDPDDRYHLATGAYAREEWIDAKLEERVGDDR